MTKASAVAALERAETAARRALTEGPPRVLPPRQSSLASLALALTPAAPPISSGAVAPAEEEEDANQQLWDPFGRPYRAARFLRASTDLHSVDSELRSRQVREDHLCSLDRQLAQVEKTRALIAEVCSRCSSDENASVPSSASQSQLPAIGRRQRSATSSKGSVACSRSRAKATVPFAAAGSGFVVPGTAKTRHPTSADSALKPRCTSGLGEINGAQKVPLRTLELRPTPCPKDAEDCACCLSPMCEGELGLKFPCPAGHLFHEGCLLDWLRTARGRTTCPVCRAWPGSGGGGGPRGRGVVDGRRGCAMARTDA
eukprot:TRINITY_DN54925_c0_g1_i1.p1 TRINITY_DN54925_c0_g1~~TRINITY_DN54925_c0_g1_i1.p1  ORF type:complete len:341 (+),score=52.06 TRINITY_DN54925_c0_g1_i1:83-1024(+)